jgi:putative SOS response-associated peptidase YedK
MCGRFTLTHDINTIARVFHVAPSLQTSPRYNIAPSQSIVTVMSNGEAHLEMLRWGLIPSWAKEESIGNRMINARAETLAEKPSFKRLLRQCTSRCKITMCLPSPACGTPGPAPMASRSAPARL